MEVDQDVGVIAIDLLKGEPRIPGPEIEGLTQLQPDSALVQTFRLLGSQAARKTKENIVRDRSNDPATWRTSAAT